MTTVDDAPRSLGWGTVALIGVVLLPLLVGAVHAFVDLGGYRAVSDNALNEMVVRSLSHHLQLVGPYARDDWSHPGPVFYFLMRPMYHVFGANSAAMAVGALAVNGVAFAGILAIGRRWGAGSWPSRWHWSARSSRSISRTSTSRFGPERVHHHEPVRDVVVLADGDAIAALRKIPGARQIAFG